MNKDKTFKSKALIITIIVILILLIAGFLLLKSKSSTSSSNALAKIFSSLNPSANSKNVDVGDKKIPAQAGEDIKKGDKVIVTGTSSDNNPIIMRWNSQNDIVFGIADQDISMGDIGEISLSNGNGWGAFWESISDIIDNAFDGNSGDDISIDPNDDPWGPGGDDDPWGPGGDDDPWGPGGDDDPWGPSGIPECRDTLDNDSDTFIDRNDPECHLNGDLTAPYIPNYDSESDSPNQNDLVECNDTEDNDTDTFIDDLDPQCHIDGDLNNQYIPTHDSESENATGGEETGLPDLTAGPISPTFSTVNSTVVLSSTVSNLGTGGTKSGFISFFTIKDISDVNQNNSNPVSTSPIKNFFSKILNKLSFVSKVLAEQDKEIEVNTLAIYANSSIPVTTSYIFTSSGLYQVRLCVDKKSSVDTGVIEETNEENNCGPWTSITISKSLPTGGITTGDDFTTIYECSDQLDNDQDGKVDDKDPNCHEDGNLNKSYIPTHNSEKTSPIGEGDENICKQLEPLIFSDTEKAKLAELLRKFYLIAPTLKTEDDIKMIYQEIDHYKALISNVTELTNECYAQTVDKNGVKNPTYAGPTTRFGNPWYKYNERGSYIDESKVTVEKSYCAGVATKGAHDGESCIQFSTKLYCGLDDPFGHSWITGCDPGWQAKTNIKEYEQILNIW